MSGKSIIVMYTFSPFPFGEAASNRIFALALCMQKAGYEIIVLSNGGKRDCDYNLEKGAYIYKGIEYRDYSVSRAGKLRRIINRNNIFNIIKKHITEEERKRIGFVYSTYRNYGLLLHFALKRIFHFPAVVDVTEWHSSNQFSYGKFNPFYLLHTIHIQYLLPRAKNIICITTYLEEYFMKRGCNTVNIPPQVMTKNYIKHKMPHMPPVRLFYAGTAAKKDYLDIMLDGLSSLNESELLNIQCTLVGMSPDVFMEQFPRARNYISSLKNSLHIINRIPKEDVDKILSESHFLILMRPKCRYSNAGFPSKVPEALAAGVPIVTNLTSDLSLYIKDMENGIIVDEFSAASFASAVRKTIKISDAQFKRMSKSAYQTAMEHFNYCVHSQDIKRFLDNAQVISKEVPN
ncbi:MAG: glycosyltransferase family 4 protein [Clostridiaceae bacterium]|nr:glycosyltransferase family 4 protein [Clostridiaceae bacterium]